MAEKRFTRRGFMVGCSAAIAAMAGSKMNYVAFGSQVAEPNQEILVVIFMRGGCDGLNFIVPLSGADRGHYEAERQSLGISTGALSPYDLGTLNAYAGSGSEAPGAAVQLALHPNAAPLYDLYQANKLAIIHAAGLDYDNRSHFDMMEYMERGTPGQRTTASGWLTRHLESSPSLPDQIIAPALAIGNLQPSSLLASRETIGTNSLTDLQLNTGYWRWQDAQRSALRGMYNAGTWLHEAGAQTLNAVDIIEGQDTSNYQPANGATYPGGGFGNNLRSIAQMIKLQLGMRIATVDLGGWDTHEYQGDNGGGYFGNKMSELAQGLSAFYTDLDGAGSENYAQRVTVAVMTEFGRKLIRNESGGTDHGHGGVMLVLGGRVNGGQLYGSWPGLDNGLGQLYSGRDLRITTDYRQILSEIMIRRLANPNIGYVFPGYGNYSPLGIMQGADLTPNYGSNPGGGQPIGPNSVYLPIVVK